MNPKIVVELHSIAYWILSLIFGTEAAITPLPITVGPQEITIQAPKPMKPVDDTMQVFVGFGKPSNEMQYAIISGKWGMAQLGRVEVRICNAANVCLPMGYAGGFVMQDKYGILFQITNESVGKATFTAVKLRSIRSLPNTSVSWQNYSQ
jgi:hypothetical protein